MFITERQSNSKINILLMAHQMNDNTKDYHKHKNQKTHIQDIKQENTQNKTNMKTDLWKVRQNLFRKV